MNKLNLLLFGVFLVCALSPMLPTQANAVGEPQKTFQCGVSDHDYVSLLNVTGSDGHTVTIACKHFIGTHDFRFAMYYDNLLLVGQCPFIKGVNHWHIELVNGNIASTYWISTGMNGASVSWLYSFHPE